MLVRSWPVVDRVHRFGDWAVSEVNTICRIPAESISVNTNHPSRDRPMRDLQPVGMLAFDEEQDHALLKYVPGNFVGEGVQA